MELSYYLKQHNISHSLLTSPHILSITERISYNGENISYDEMEELLQRVLSRFGEQKLSFYELLFLMFIEGHSLHPADVMINEVGLGGRFDAVNAVSPTLTAIVSIGYDHTEILGDNLKGILQEKLGITRPGVPLFTSITQENLRQFCKDYCEREGVVLHDLWDWEKVPRSYTRRNSLLSQALAGRIIEKSLDEVAAISLRGRWESAKTFTFVAAHNGDGLSAMAEDSRIKDFKGIIFSFSEREDRFVSEMFNILTSFGRPLYFFLPASF